MTKQELQEMRMKLLKSRLKAERLARELREFEQKIDVLLEKKKPPE